VLSLGVESGYRAKYIVEQIKSLSKEEAINLIKDYSAKKIITSDVVKQMTVLLAGLPENK
jgi:hypothetical protein